MRPQDHLRPQITSSGYIYSYASDTCGVRAIMAHVTSDVLYLGLLKHLAFEKQDLFLCHQEAQVSELFSSKCNNITATQLLIWKRLCWVKEC